MSRILPGEGEFEILCECVRLSCVETIAMSAERYRAAREGEQTFIVIPGHEDAGVDRVVNETAGYLLELRVASHRPTRIARL
jgi:hypothetical protein